MRAIGFRASPTGVVFAIIEGEVGPSASPFKVLAGDAVPIPAALWPPNQLHFVRTVLLDVMEEFGVERAGLRLTEYLAGKSHPFRDNIEGVIQELLASSDVAWYIAGRNATLARDQSSDRPSHAAGRISQLMRVTAAARSAEDLTLPVPRNDRP